MTVPSLEVVNNAIGLEMKPLIYTYTERDVSLYALGIGAPADWLDPSELKFVYELSGEGFKVIPSFGVIYSSAWIESILSGNIAGIEFDPIMVVHGEQYLEIKKPLPTSSTITTIPKIINIFDKGSGLLMVTEKTGIDENGDVLVVNKSSMFIRGLGGFGGERGTSEKVEIPNREPDVVHEEKTLDIQALIYRLSGDVNPLHADPQMAAVGNFETPILHGLSFFGFATRAIIKHFCGNDSDKLTSIGVRFSKHVFPADTLITEMWQVSDTKIVFQMKSKERDVIVLSNATATIEG
jgi:(3R)-3-hydroxyacyl-CoA dehydrogenase / 3a,7a,12a-trihydroxy-5b-cholest-24-enoyl-CoA hydratase / enoyl-CoA hydratase 2